jgi:hypothetical protein
MPRSSDQAQGSQPDADAPAKASPPPGPNPTEHPTSPEKSTDVHGEPETPV